MLVVVLFLFKSYSEFVSWLLVFYLELIRDFWKGLMVV